MREERGRKSSHGQEQATAARESDRLIIPWYFLCETCPNRAGQVLPTRVRRRLEPVAAICHPPARISDGNGGEHRPPEGQRQVRHQAQSAESEPKNLSLHLSILTGIRVVGAASAEAIPQLP